MNLLSTPNRLGISRPHEDARQIAYRTRDLFAELLKRTIDTPTIDGRPVFVDMCHVTPVQTRTSTSAAEAMENYEGFNGLSHAIGTRLIQVDTPIPRRRELPTSASRLRVTLRATSGNQELYGYDLTAYDPLIECDPDFVPTVHQPPEQLYFQDDNVRHHLLIRGDVTNPGRYNIRTAIQTASDIKLGTVSFAYLDQRNLEVTETMRVLPELTRQEERVLDLGASTLAYYQLHQDLSIMSALVGQDPTQPMGAY